MARNAASALTHLPMQIYTYLLTCKQIMQRKKITAIIKIYTKKLYRKVGSCDREYQKVKGTHGVIKLNMPRLVPCCSFFFSNDFSIQLRRTQQTNEQTNAVVAEILIFFWFRTWFLM